MIDLTEPRLLREEMEKNLSPFAARSAASRGRQLEESPCSVRTAYERDAGRIIFSLDFRRMRQKTQVFFNPKNDHICTRMEHVITVDYIAHTIGRALNLNLDLIKAIALGHDLGHAPFGHSGEATLDQCFKTHDTRAFFQHEVHSLRIIDLLASHHKRMGLNLTFEVRDGIACHCGETYDEYQLVPKRHKQAGNLAESARLHEMPATLEGCVVRMVDKIAYVGRDIEDAVRAGIMAHSDLPASIQKVLGRTNGEIINTLVKDIIKNSYGKDAIILSPHYGESLHELLQFNFERIYSSAKIKRYELMVSNVIEGLYEALAEAIRDPEKLAASDNRVLASFHEYLADRYQDLAQLGPQQVVDYIAGMTDSYATKSFEDLYWT